MPVAELPQNTKNGGGIFGGIWKNQTYFFDEIQFDKGLLCVFF